MWETISLYVEGLFIKNGETCVSTRIMPSMLEEGVLVPCFAMRTELPLEGVILICQCFQLAEKFNSRKINLLS
jgi:hypothetical protein